MRHARSLPILALLALSFGTVGPPASAQSAEGEAPAASPTPVKVRLRPVLMKKESVRLEPVLTEPVEPAATPESAPAPSTESEPAAPPEVSPAPVVEPAETAPPPPARPEVVEPSEVVESESAPAPAAVPFSEIEEAPAPPPEPTPEPRAPVVETPVPVTEVRPTAPAESAPPPATATDAATGAPRPSSVRLERTGTEASSPASRPEPTAKAVAGPPDSIQAEAPAPVTPLPAATEPVSSAPPSGEATPPPAPPAPRVLVEDATATQLLVQVRAAIDAGDTAGGRVMAMRLAERHPDSTAAPEALFLATSGLDDLGGAVRELLALTERYPDSPAAGAALVRAGEFSFLLGDHAGAASAFERYMARADASPDRLPQVESRRALALLRAARFPEARAAFEALFDSREEMLDSPAMLESYAETLMGLGDHVAAREILDRVDGRFPSYENAVKVLLGRGLCAEILGDTEAARRIFSTIVSNYPESLEAPLAGRRVADLGRPLVP